MGVRNYMSKEILQCCGKNPEVFDFTFVSGCPIKTLIQCTICGHHIHSIEGFSKAILIWNRSMRSKL